MVQCVDRRCARRTVPRRRRNGLRRAGPCGDLRGSGRRRLRDHRGQGRDQLGDRLVHGQDRPDVAILIRNGASDDLATLPPTLRDRTLAINGRLRVLYQGLVGGKKLKVITTRLAELGCDVDLAVFVDSWSNDEVELIRRSWNGVGRLTIHANCDALKLAQLMELADVALNPVPEHMDYAFTVKTADYAVRGLPPRKVKA